MIPSLWFWAPQFHFPFSGSVAQRIAPDFFSNIGSQAGRANGDGDVEREAFDIASYGRQLGLISEVLLSMAGKDTVSRAKGEESLERLQAIYLQVEEVKRRHQASELEDARLALEKLQQTDPAALAALLQGFSAAPPRLAAPARR
ncbi:hypothetical protein ACFPOE_21910 [Caenimonas terrae]|uniref:Uncharacterized protein n=1 Tax=Caenimonas terrae TaxID=696074 RepID=A0ABW0NMS2_9BURK